MVVALFFILFASHSAVFLSCGGTNHQDWGKLFHNSAAASAIADRLVHKGLLVRTAALAEVARAEGLLLCPEGATTYAAYKQALAAGRIGAGARVVLFNCATGLKYPLPPVDRAPRNRKGSHALRMREVFAWHEQIGSPEQAPIVMA